MEYLQLSSSHGVSTITINRPKALNALNTVLLQELQLLIDELADDPKTRVICLRGGGDKAFAAGADIKEFQDITADRGSEISAVGHKLFQQMETFPKPIVAAIQGYALGGGLELAMACHLRVCNASAKMGLPEVNLGLMPGYGGSTRLPELVGTSMALHMMLTGTHIDAQKALMIGLVSEVYDNDSFDESLKKLLSTLASKAPLAQAAIIEISTSTSISREDKLKLEQDQFGKLMVTEDCKEGVQAFIEKRKAIFKGL